MSSSTSELRGRPMSEVPASPPNGAPFKTFGQEYQYAETLQNPFPEVIFSGPENTAHTAASTSPAAIGGMDGTNEGPADHETRRSSLRLGTPGSKEPAMPENVWVEPPEAPWYKAISLRRWAAIIICTAGITGVVLAILGAMNKLSGERSDSTDSGPDSPTPGKTSADQTSSSDTPSAAESTSATPTTFVTLTTPGNAKPTNEPTTKIDCSNPSTFLTPVSWVGTTVGAYKSEFAALDGPAASAASACCRACEERAGGGCAGWLYNPGSQFTPCTLVVINVDQAGRDEADEACPRGRTGTTFFNGGLAEDGSSGTAGMGPCAREGHVN
ncbi:hypothetical protein B0I37DRAFT_39668 [Chaetomium sp. MPI-CAGE-AT-0009]|nr:hypothetical protein B0I37DRAFT_39668 [Chaetomium sp. MPI-CAGE-AT-0009]